MGILDGFFALTGLGYIGARVVAEKMFSTPGSVYRAEAETLCNKLTPADYITEKCVKICDNPEELFRILHKELTYIFGSHYQTKFQIDNPAHLEAAVQLQLSQNKRGNKVLTAWDVVNGDCGLPVKWKNTAEKRFWMDVYQCIEWNLQEKYSNLQFVLKPDMEYDALHRESVCSWDRDGKVLVPTQKPERPFIRLW